MVGMKDGHPIDIAGLEGTIQREKAQYHTTLLHPLCRPHFPQRSSSADAFWSHPTRLRNILDWLGAMTLSIEGSVLLLTRMGVQRWMDAT